MPITHAIHYSIQPGPALHRNESPLLRGDYLGIIGLVGRDGQVTAIFAKTPEPPYYAVIFSSLRTPDSGYAEMAKRMLGLAAEQTGFLGAESVRGQDGFGITVSYWTSEEAIADWKANVEHLAAQELGKTAWYQHYELRIAKVERAYEKPKKKSV